MTKEYRITAANFADNGDPNCQLPDDDPAHQLISGQMPHKALPIIKTNNNAQTQREQNIKPGTQEWFQLWFKRKE